MNKSSFCLKNKFLYLLSRHKIKKILHASNVICITEFYLLKNKIKLTHKDYLHIISNCTAFVHDRIVENKKLSIKTILFVYSNGDFYTKEKIKSDKRYKKWEATFGHLHH